MGYPVYYDGEVSISPPLSEEHAATLMAAVNHEESEAARPLLEAIASSEDASSLPRYGLFDLSDERDTVLPEEGESRHGLGLSLRLLQKHFFVPLGHALDGAINWSSEDPEDRGCIYLKGDHIEAVLDRIVNDGPNWSPSHYADDRLITCLGQLVASADSTGCSEDLTVVSREHIAALRVILDGLGAKHAEEDPETKPSAQARGAVADPRPYVDYFSATAEAHRRADSTRTTHYVHEDLDPSLSPAFLVNQDPHGATYTAVPEEV
jgi:hypothetical protein